MDMIKPASLNPGDRVELITPASLAAVDHIQLAVERFRALGFTVKPGKHLFDQDGYFAGSAKDNVQALHDAFQDDEIKAIVAVRGGYGSARLLPYLDFDLIKANPKVIMGFSDLTALLNAITTKTGLVTFHGPTAGQPLHPTSKAYFERIFCDAEAITLKNPDTIPSDDIIPSKHRTNCIHPGRAKGRLLGGNFTVFNTLLATEYCPADFSNCILFFEDINEDVYKIDRLLCQLELHGILKQIKGIIFGSFKRTKAAMHQSFRLEEVLAERIEPLQIPAFRGAMFGHQAEQYILPVGQLVTMDAMQGTIKFDSPAVTSSTISSQGNQGVNTLS